MRLNLGITLVSLTVSSAQYIAVEPCGSSESQEWTFGAGGSVIATGTSPELCLSAANCSSPQSLDAVLLLPCGNNRCPANADQSWNYSSAPGWLWSSLSPSPQMCLTLAGTYGPGVNLWPCAEGGNSSAWTRSGLQLQSRQGGSAAGSCLQYMAQGSIINVNGSVIGRRFDGIGGLAAIGGARLLYEYPEQQRDDLLDLLFLASGGAAYQVGAVTSVRMGEGAIVFLSPRQCPTLHLDLADRAPPPAAQDRNRGRHRLELRIGYARVLLMPLYTPAHTIPGAPLPRSFVPPHVRSCIDFVPARCILTLASPGSS
jgi:hypothetical protein